MSSDLDHAMVDGIADDVGCARGTDLAHRGRAVSFNCLDTDIQNRADFPARPPLRDELDHRALSNCKRAAVLQLPRF